MFFNAVFLFARTLTLTVHHSDIYVQVFPSACGTWATDGCTRIVYQQEQCLRPIDIPKDYNFYAEWTSSAAINDAV